MQNELKALLYESVSSAQIREAEAFDKMAGDGKNKIILFGSGELGRRTFAGLKKLRINIIGYTDNKKELWGTEIDGVKVFSPEEAVTKFPNAVFVLTIWSAYIGHPLKEVQIQLNAFGKANVISFIYLFWKYPETFLPFWRIDLPHKTINQFELVAAAYSLWSDKQSQEEYLGQIKWRITGDSSKLTPPVKLDQYFPEDIFKVNNNEVFVDIGAFDGDTLKVFLEKSSKEFEHYYAYEPDPFGYIKLKEYVGTLPEELNNKIDIEPIGIGSHTQKISIETPGVYFKILYPAETADHSGKNVYGYVTVDSKSIDELTFNKIPTFIKMDVEGYEPNIIFGALRFIKKYKPIIAFSIYHKFDHLWKLPLAVHAISSDYNYYLRPHFHAGWELICYAVPKHRLNNTLISK